MIILRIAFTYYCREDEFKGNKDGWMCTVHVSTNDRGKEEGGMCTVHVKNEETNHKGDLEMCGIIILKLIFEKQNINV
jgi:hypothetical protein